MPNHVPDTLHKGLRISLLILRIALGGLMFEAGLDKLLSGTFSSASYIQRGTGPFAEIFGNLVPNMAIVNFLVIGGEIAIGLALIFGILVRLASYFGTLMMLMYFLPYIPPSNTWINQQIIYLIIFITLIFSGIGYFLGLDSLFKRLDERKSWLSWLFG
jgi:thiosulfate dehydrogenase (quinone) large subunit